VWFGLLLAGAIGVVGTDIAKEAGIDLSNTKQLAGALVATGFWAYKSQEKRKPLEDDPE
jgi:hypothetical protein